MCRAVCRVNRIDIQHPTIGKDAAGSRSLIWHGPATLESRGSLMRASNVNSTRRQETRTYMPSHLDSARINSDHEDDVDDSLHQAQELIRRAMSTRNRYSRQIRHLPGDDTAFQGAVDEMITKAQREVLCVLSARELCPNRRPGTVRLLQHAERRGVQVKALLPAPVAATDAAVIRAVSGQPGYRTRELPDENLVIADGREAALRTPHRAEEPAQTLLVSVRSLVHVLRTMFGVTWSSGVPLGDILDVHEKLREEPARSVIASLSAGDKDEVGARKLGISVRTYRRHVADIMREMNANSRFQAGLRAAELGIII
ncbi:hypothetical protein E1258_19590 [Micromonospora sp. KC207]|nr:hypothetical protein E1258_19590 [Micromonospora sp. KC207]